MVEDIHFRIYPITRVKWLFQIHRDEVVKVNRHEFLFSLNDVVTSLHLEILICPNGAFKGWWICTLTWWLHSYICPGLLP